VALIDADAVRAVLVTHAHADHAGGAAAFPQDAAALARGGRALAAVADGERLVIGDTAFEAFALPGHTAGSAAHLVHGVLFLGDAAASTAAAEVVAIAFGHQGPAPGLDPLLAWARTRAATAER